MDGVDFVEYVDDNGTPYFFNVVTEELVWDVPEGVNTISEADYMASLSSSVEKDVRVEDDEARDERRREFMKAALSGKISKMDPTVKRKLHEAKIQQANIEANRVASLEAGEEHWVEVYDPNSDAYYYYGAISQQVVWGKPPSYTMAADNELMTAVIKIQCAYRARLARHRMHAVKEDPNALNRIIDINGIAWQKEQDTSGATYYQNEESGESQWEEPKMKASSSEGGSSATTRPASTLITGVSTTIITGWYVKSVDGQRMYCHRSSGVCQADRPEGYDGEEPENTMVSKKSSESLPASKDIKNKTVVEKKKEKQPTKEDIWVEVYDPIQQRLYYYGSISTSIQSIKPDHYILAKNDVKISAVITIQCAWRVRIAKRRVALCKRFLTKKNKKVKRMNNIKY